MSILTPLALLLVLVAVCCLGPAYRRYRVRAELPGDWWVRFERDLRQYMSQNWSSAREAERRP